MRTPGHRVAAVKIACRQCGWHGPGFRPAGYAPIYWERWCLSCIAGSVAHLRRVVRDGLRGRL